MRGTVMRPTGRGSAPRPPGAVYRQPSLILALAAMLVVLLTASADARSAPDEGEGTAFTPMPVTTDDYAIGPPEVKYVKAPDGAKMYVEYYRPVRGPGNIEPAARYPVILNMTPYEAVFPAALDDAIPVEGLGSPPESPYHDQIRNRFVPKGYAVAIGHVYGTGNSEGCQELGGPNEVAAASAVVEWLGTAPWSNGRVGMIGTSYDAGVGLHVATHGSEAARKYLAAVVSDAGYNVSWADAWGHDGVPAIPGAALTSTGTYAATSQAPALLSPRGESETDATATADRLASRCRAENLDAAQRYERSGSISRWISDRSLRADAPSISSPILMFQGFHDLQTVAHNLTGFFDRIPKSTPHKLVLGQWGHAQTNQYRADGWAIRQAWFDRFLLDHPTAVEDWPRVQVQDTTGRWRAEPSWPSTGGPAGQLTLSEGLTLGQTDPAGTTSYSELPRADTQDPLEQTFRTPALEAPLHITGQPVLDLWVVLDRDDAHIAAVFEAFDRDGNAITSEGLMDSRGRSSITAHRSVQHLEPIRRGEFRQGDAVPAPVGEPIHVPVRFYSPLDLVIPQGGWVSIRLTGNSGPELLSAPSGSDTRVTILHDCQHPSALRFLMPRAEPEFLNVQRTARVQPQLFPVDADTGGQVADGGLATEKVCGKKPLDPQQVLAER